MKMRGYSVLFVCALCVFVLCGAAAVVAQDVTPEKVAAETAKNITNAATEKGLTALEDYRAFEGFVDFAENALSTAIDAMSVSNTIADTLSLPGQVPSKEDIKEEIGRLQTAMTGVKNAVVALKAPDADSLSNESKQDEIIYKIAGVENKMREAEQAAAAVTDNITTIDAVIEKAGELQAAAEAAMTLWTAARGMLTAQLGELDAAVAALNKTKNDIEEAAKKFANNTSLETRTLNEQLTYISTVVIPRRVEVLIFLKSWLQNTTNTAEEAKNVNTALAAAAEELKGKAEERKQKVQIQPHLLQIQADLLRFQADLLLFQADPLQNKADLDHK